MNIKKYSIIPFLINVFCFQLARADNFDLCKELCKRNGGCVTFGTAANVMTSPLQFIFLSALQADGQYNHACGQSIVKVNETLMAQGRDCNFNDNFINLSLNHQMAAKLEFLNDNRLKINFEVAKSPRFLVPNLGGSLLYLSTVAESSTDREKLFWETNDGTCFSTLLDQ